MWEQVREGADGASTITDSSIIGYWKEWRSFSKGCKNFNLKEWTGQVGLEWNQGKQVLCQIFLCFLRSERNWVTTSTVWNPLVPTKVGFFSWEAIQLLINLEGRGWSILNRCFMSKWDDELVDHFSNAPK